MDPAYIAIAEDGHLTLYGGDGTESQKTVIARGPQASSGAQLIEDIEAFRRWAQAQGFEVITPAYDLEAPRITLEPTQNDLDNLDPGDIDALLDDLDSADQAWP